MNSSTPTAPVAPDESGSWVGGLALTLAGSRRYALFRPADAAVGERLPLMVMLHGCGQDAAGFAASTGMNALAARHRFMVLYPEQSTLYNPNGCWNWFCTASGRAYAEVEIIVNAIDQVSRLYGADPQRIVIGGLSAGASMAALVATRHPELFKAVVMHSGVPPGTATCGLSALDAMRGQAATPPIDAYAGLARRLPPLLAIHGMDDDVVAPSNSRAAAGAWAAAAGAVAGEPRTARPARRYAARITAFAGSPLATATLVEIDGLGHAWSGGDAREPFGDDAGPDASVMMWCFARRASRAARAELAD